MRSTARTDAEHRLPAEAYYSTEWFDLEQERVQATTWHRIDASVAAHQLGLQVDAWEGMAFASARPSHTLAEALSGLPEAIGSFRPSELVEVGRADMSSGCNWKLFIENHIDVLHLWYLHDESLAAYDHTRFEHAALGRNWASYEPIRPGRQPMPGAVIEHLADRDRQGLGAHLLFPDTPMAASASFFATYRAVPVGPEETRVELRVLAEPGADADTLVAATRSFIEEDLEACERIQAAVRSSRWEIGPLARDHERPITAFHDHLLGLLGREPSETAAR